MKSVAVGLGFTPGLRPQIPDPCPRRGGRRVPLPPSPIHSPHLSRDYGDGIKTSDSGIPTEHVKMLANFPTKHNHIRVLQISPAADGHPFSGARLLLLDGPGNIHSVWFPFSPLTRTYLDVFATLPPLLPPGPVAVLGLGGASVARLLTYLNRGLEVHGWEKDPLVLSVARTYFGLSKLEHNLSRRFFVYLGDALQAQLRGGFSGVMVNLVAKGCVVRQLQEGATWRRIKTMLKKGGRVMANLGGSCLEAESKWRDGRRLVENSLQAMQEVFPDQVSVLFIGNGTNGQNVLALTGDPPNPDYWSNYLPHPLSLFPHMWTPFKNPPLALSA